MRITLVTITYNAEATLPATLESVRMQSHDDLEHLIIDGASKDSTLSLARDYARTAPEGHEVTVVSEPDDGLYDAMNKGLRLASGAYVCFLNAGDRLPDADTVARVAETAGMAGDGCLPGVLYGDTDIVDGDGRFICHRHLSPPARLSWRSFRHGMLVCHQAFYASVELAREVPYDTRYRYSADVDWCIRVMKKAEERKMPLTRVSGVLALYLSEGQTTLHHRESLRERFRVMCRHYGWLSTLSMHLWFVLRAAKRKIWRR